MSLTNWDDTVTGVSAGAHKARHQDAGADEISVTGLSGLLADDQHVLDAEVTAVAVAKSLFDAHTVVYATADNTPLALTVNEQSVVGRVTSGNIAALTGAQLWAILTGQAAAGVSMNSQNLSAVGTIGCGAITTTGALNFTNTDTAVWLSAANTLSIKTSNIECFQIDNNGAAQVGRAAITGWTSRVWPRMQLEVGSANVCNLLMWSETYGGEFVLATNPDTARTWHIDNDTGGTPGSSMRFFYQPTIADSGVVLLTLGVGVTTFAVNTITGIVTTDATDIEIGAAGGIKSGSTNGDTFLIKANDTTFITLTTGATDTCEIDNTTLDTCVGKGTWTASGTWTIPAVTLGGTVAINSQKFSGVAIFGAAAPAGGSGNLNSVVAATGTSGVFSDNTNSEFYIRHPSAGVVKLDTDSGNVIEIAAGGTTHLTIGATGTLTAGTSIWWREFHMGASAANPGASGPTFTPADANTIGGYQLNAATEILQCEMHVHPDWDAATDLIVEVTFEVNVDNTGGGAGDTVDLKSVLRYKGDAETAIKTQTVEVATTVGQSARYKQFTASFTIDYDLVSNVVEVGDVISMQLNLETDTSEVDDVIINHMVFKYKTRKVSPEV